MAMRGRPKIAGAEHRFIDTGEVTLHAVIAGEGPLVVLLHGFPEFWWSWRHQLSALAGAGFRAVAVDLRGCGLSDRPRDVGAYSVRQLASDVDRLIAALGAERAAAVVGHDWGGVIAYSFAARYPARVERLVILNAPHPVAMSRGLLRNGQLLRSAYMLALVVPAIPERVLASRDGALVRRAVRAMRSTQVPADELEPYVVAARGAEWLRGGLNMYRAMARTALARVPGVGLLVRRSRGARAADPVLRSSDRIDAPVLVIWGAADPFLAEHLARPPAAIVPNVRIERIPRASHDVMLDAPERVNTLMLDFLAPASKPSGS
jgi:pimeloyl-ACP methyl ester carboxylesterase